MEETTTNSQTFEITDKRTKKLAKIEKRMKNLERTKAQLLEEEETSCVYSFDQLSTEELSRNDLKDTKKALKAVQKKEKKEMKKEKKKEKKALKFVRKEEKILEKEKKRNAKKKTEEVVQQRDDQEDLLTFCGDTLKEFEEKKENVKVSETKEVNDSKLNKKEMKHQKKEAKMKKKCEKKEWKLEKKTMKLEYRLDLLRKKVQRSQQIEADILAKLQFLSLRQPISC